MSQVGNIFFANGVLATEKGSMKSSDPFFSNRRIEGAKPRNDVQPAQREAMGLVGEVLALVMHFYLQPS